MERSLPFRTDMKRSHFATINGCAGAVVIGLSMVLVGCGGNSASVNGTVRMDGKPLAAAGVMFHPKTGAALISATTDGEGRYQAESGNSFRIPPGEYTVTISKDRTTGLGPGGIPIPGRVRTEHLIPAIYGKTDMSPLHVVVAPGSQSHDFELSSNPALK